jgi:hypothetical protein
MDAQKKVSNTIPKADIRREIICQLIDKVLIALDDWKIDDILLFQGNDDAPVDPEPECYHEKAAQTVSKSVRFADLTPQLLLEETALQNDDLSIQEIQSLWWSAEEIQEFQHCANQVADSVKNHGNQVAANMIFENIYETATRLASFCDEQSMQGNFMDPPEQHVRFLVQWNEQGNARGLELYAATSNSTMATAVSLHRKKVLDTYQLFKDNLFTAQVSQNMTRGSQLFARLAGCADALVIEKSNL